MPEIWIRLMLLNKAKNFCSEMISVRMIKVLEAIIYVI